MHTLGDNSAFVKEALYRIWCGVSRLGDSGVNRLGDISAFVNPTGQILLTRRGKTRMDGVGIVFEFYTAPLQLAGQLLLARRGKTRMDGVGIVFEFYTAPL